MHLLRRSKSSGDISASAPIFPASLVRKLASKRKPNTLALSSASVALSIGSPFSNTRSVSFDENTGRGGESGWQMAYATARMAVEIAKESSDTFPPLKAVVGAISVLIQNCDVSSSCSCNDHSLKSPYPASSGQCRGGKGHRGEGALAIERARRSCKQG